jgi:hypothetical protein
MSRPATTKDKCAVCKDSLHPATVQVISPNNCRTHPQLKAHFQCYVTSVRPQCECNGVTRCKMFPINHGDSLMNEPIWVPDVR